MISFFVCSFKHPSNLYGFLWKPCAFKYWEAFMSVTKRHLNLYFEIFRMIIKQNNQNNITVYLWWRIISWLYVISFCSNEIITSAIGSMDTDTVRARDTTIFSKTARGHGGTRHINILYAWFLYENINHMSGLKVLLFE